MKLRDIGRAALALFVFVFVVSAVGYYLEPEEAKQAREERKIAEAKEEQAIKERDARREEVKKDIENRFPDDSKVLTAAQIACDNRAKNNASHPDTVDFDGLKTDRSLAGGDSGRIANIQRVFTAKNSFGAETEYVYLCSYEDQRITRFEITQI